MGNCAFGLTDRSAHGVGTGLLPATAQNPSEFDAQLTFEGFEGTVTRDPDTTGLVWTLPKGYELPKDAAEGLTLGILVQ